jgi:hypothetical protein
MRNVERSMIIRECVVHLTIVQVTSLVGVSGFCLSSIIFVHLMHTVHDDGRIAAANTDH